MTRHQPIVGLLAALCTTFLVATIWLYVTNDRNNRQFASAGQSVVAKVYSSQLNLIRLNTTLEQCRGDVGCVYQDITERLERLARSLAELADSVGPSRRADLYSSVVGKLIKEYGSTGQHSSEVPSALAEALDDLDLRQLSEETAPLGAQLQAIMSEGLREVASARTEDGSTGLADVSIAFAIMVFSWAGLTILLTIEVRQRGKLLRKIRTMHHAETELQRSTVRLLQSLPIPVLLTNAEGLVYANQAARTLASVPGRIDSLSNLAQALSQQFAAGGSDSSATTRDFTYFHVDGTLRQLSASISDIPLTGTRHRVYLILDNTLLRDAELRAMTSGKLAVLGELSSAVAHELNQPLAVIKAAAANGKMLAGNLEASRPVIEKFERIDNQIERARRIIGNVRKLGQPRQAETPFSVARSLDSTFGLVSEQFRLAGVTLEIDVELGEALTIVGDYTLFEIAILNILLNARDAFENRPQKAQPATVHVKGCFKDGMIRIEILDDAGGIPEELLPHIFESFVSSKSTDKGTGLGLSIARRAIEGMHGKIAAENTGGGALFTILLPAFVKEAVA